MATDEIVFLTRIAHGYLSITPMATEFEPMTVLFLTALMLTVPVLSIEDISSVKSVSEIVAGGIPQLSSIGEITKNIIG